MKFFKTTFIFLLIVLVLAFSALFIFFNMNKQTIVQAALNKIFKRAVEIEEIKYQPPTTLILKKLNVPDLFEVQRVQLQLSFPAIVGKNVVLSSVQLVRPHIVIHRTEDKEVVLGKASPADKKASPKAAESAAPDGIGNQIKEIIDIEGLSIENLNITDGQLQFLSARKDKNFQITFEEMELEANMISYPLSPTKTEFMLKAVVQSKDIPFSGSNVEVDGWVNYLKRNMDSRVEIIESSGETSLAAHLKSDNNDMDVQGKVKLGKLNSYKNQEEEDQSSVEDFIFGALDATGLELDMDFSFKTKMDDFEIGSVSLSGNIGFKGAEEGTKESLKDIGKQFEAFGKKFYEETVEKSSEKEILAE